MWAKWKFGDKHQTNFRIAFNRKRNNNLQMKELDLLKKDWQKDTAFEQVSEVEIYKMLHKKSSSIVKWILIVSLLEFVVLNATAFAFSTIFFLSMALPLAVSCKAWPK